MTTLASTPRTFTAVGLALAFSLVPASFAADITWANSAGNTTWTSNSTNGVSVASASWVGGNTPVNSVTADNAIFTSVSNAQPTLATQTRIAGVDFQMAAGGLTMNGGGGGGNLFQVGAGGIDASLQTSGTNTITNARIAVFATSTWNLFSTANTTSTSTFTFNSTVDLGTNSLTIAGQRDSAAGNVGNINFSRAITGNTTSPGTLTINSTSANNNVTFSGNNTYLGVTNVNAGIVNVENNQSAATGGWNIQTPNTAGAPVATVNFLSGSTIEVASASKIQIGRTGNTGENIASTLNVAGVVSNNGTLQLERAGVLNLNSGAVWSQNGNLTLTARGGGSSTLNVNAGSNMTYSGATTVKLNSAGGSSGTGSLNIAGTGLFTTGAGFENLTTNSAGSGVSRVRLTNGGTLRLSADVANLTTETRFDLGTGGGVIDTNGFSTSLSGVTTVGSNTNAAGITGAGSLTKTGIGTLTLTGNNTYSGGTTVSAGTLLVNNTTGSGTGSGPVTVSSGATVGGTGSISGATTVNGGTVNGTLSLTTLVATGNSTIASTVTASGGTSVSSGNLTVSGVLGGGAVTIQSGATLKGAGTVNGATTVQSGGFLAPGDSPGALVFGDNLVVAGTVKIELGGTAFTLNGTEDYDRIKLSGATATLNLAGSTLNVAQWNSFVPVPGDKFGIFQLESDATISSTLGGFAEGATVATIGGQVIKITYVADFGDSSAIALTGGNDIALYAPIPEPSAYAAFAGLGMIGFALYRRRRQQKTAAAA